MHDWSLALSSISRTILSLLLLKELLIVFAVGVNRYFKTGPHVIDFIIVVVAWSLELYYFVNERQINQSFKDGRPLLFMIVIAWRVVRMVHILLENITGIWLWFLFLWWCVSASINIFVSVATHKAEVEEAVSIDKTVISNLRQTGTDLAFEHKRARALRKLSHSIALLYFVLI